MEVSPQLDERVGFVVAHTHSMRVAQLRSLLRDWQYHGYYSGKKLDLVASVVMRVLLADPKTFARWRPSTIFSVFHLSPLHAHVVFAKYLVSDRPRRNTAFWAFIRPLVEDGGRFLQELEKLDRDAARTLCDRASGRTLFRRFPSHASAAQTRDLPGGARDGGLSESSSMPIRCSSPDDLICRSFRDRMQARSDLRRAFAALMRSLEGADEVRKRRRMMDFVHRASGGPDAVMKSLVTLMPLLPQEDDPLYAQFRCTTGGPSITQCQVSLSDPLSLQRLRVPARCLDCKHVQCFDAEHFVRTQLLSNSWACPLCSADSRYGEHLYQSDAMRRILDEHRDVATRHVAVNSDGRTLPVQSVPPECAIELDD